MEAIGAGACFGIFLGKVCPEALELAGGKALVEKRAKILVLCPDLPFPIRAGGQMRMASLIQALSEFASVKVAFIAPQTTEETISWARERNVSLEQLVPRNRSLFERWSERLGILFARSNLRYRLHERTFFNQAFKSYSPDLVWLETPYLLRYAIKWKEKVPLVVDYWGTSEGANRICKVTRGPLKIWKWLFWRAALRGEMQFAPQVENIVCVSSLDAAFFRNLAPESRIWAIPNGILTKNTQRPTVAVADDPSIMIFTGDMSYLPNIDAAVWFTEQVFPIILREVPWAKMQIVGREPRGEVLALRGHQNVEVKGHMPDLAASIAAAGFYILPMRLGSGIRSKLFDVFPLGKAIVSTSTGAEGLELHHDVNCIIADSAEDFAKGCIRLLKNENERHRLGKAVSLLASETYSQENVNRLVRKAVIDILRS